MNELTPSKEKAAELRALQTRLKCGEYDGTDIMRAWIWIAEYAHELEKQSAHEPGTDWNAQALTRANQDISRLERELRDANEELKWRREAEGTAQPPRGDDPNEGPIGPDGLLVIADGVLPPFYNGWKCSQSGKDPEAIKANGPCSCGRGKPTLTKGPEHG